MEHKAKILGVALLCLALGSEALTLGRVRGAALVGQPLNMVIAVQLDAGEDAASLCFEADVFHADTRQDGSRVRVLVEATAQAQLVNVRIMSGALVDEPVVTVYLRTGCGQKTSRRYVLLADMPSEIAAPAVPLLVPPVSLAPVPASEAPPAAGAAVSQPPFVRPGPAAVATARRTPRARPPVRTEDMTLQPAGKAAAPSANRGIADDKSKPGRTSGQSRLKLDPLEFLSDRMANIEFPVPITSPEVTLQNLQRMQTLEASMKALLASAAKSEASLLDLKVRLQKAESERSPDGLVYALIALVLACLAAVAWLWSRQRRMQSGRDPWWHESVAPPASAEPSKSAPWPATRAVESPHEPSETPVTKKAAGEAVSKLAPLSQDSRFPPAVDVNHMDMSDSFFDDFMKSGEEKSASQTLLSPPVRPPRALIDHDLNSGAVIDIRQQAEFFVSLEKPDQAVRLLTRYIRESAQPNPFIYLDLLSLLHALDLKADFQKFRKEFNRLFNGVVPEFSAFLDEGRDIESYPDVFARITALWQTAGILLVIEACLFRDARDASLPSFDLAAFRELLMLHTVARACVPGLRAPGDEHAIAPSPAPVSQAGALVDLPLDVPELPLLLDLDLSDSQMSELAHQPESAAHIDLPLLPPDDPPMAAFGADSTGLDDGGNLIDFELPVERKPRGNLSI